MMRQDGDEFVGFAGVRQGDEHVVGGDHAEVAVAGFGRMHEEAGRAGARERGRELAGDMPGFADARYHHAALASEQEFDRAGEVVVELMADRPRTASASISSTVRASASARSPLIFAIMRGV